MPDQEPPIYHPPQGWYADVISLLNRISSQLASIHETIQQPPPTTVEESLESIRATIEAQHYDEARERRIFDVAVALAKRYPYSLSDIQPLVRQYDEDIVSKACKIGQALGGVPLAPLATALAEYEEGD